MRRNLPRQRARRQRAKVPAPQTAAACPSRCSILANRRSMRRTNRGPLRAADSELRACENSRAHTAKHCALRVAISRRAGESDHSKVARGAPAGHSRSGRCESQCHGVRSRGHDDRLLRRLSANDRAARKNGGCETAQDRDVWLEPRRAALWERGIDSVAGRARSVTCTGSCERWTGRARCGVFARGPGLRPACFRAPPQRAGY